MAEGKLTQAVRTTDPGAAPTGFITLYNKNGQYFFINDAGTITRIPLDTESVQDIVGAMTLGGTGIDATYDDGADTLTISIDSSTMGLINGALQPHDNVSELNNDSGYVDAAGAAASAPVQSVNGQTGTVVIDTVFGSEAEDFLDTTNVSYTGNTLFEAYSFTTASKPAGKYRVMVHLQLEPGATNGNDVLLLRIDGNEIGLPGGDAYEGKDIAGDVRKGITLIGYYNHGSTGTFDIELWARQQPGNGTSVIHGIMAEVWRVS